MTPADWDDPHPRYHLLRQTTPILEQPETDSWLLTRFADCEAVLRDPRFSVDERRRRARPGDDPIPDSGDQPVRTLLEIDPPAHTRIRRLVGRTFTPRTVEGLRPHVRDVVEELLDGALAIDPGRPFDLIAALADPLPTTVICELLGVPTADRELFRPWSSAATRSLDGPLDEASATAAIEGLAHIVDYLDALADERRRSPRDDMVSRLLAVEEAGDHLTRDELRALVVLLFIAGHETTTNLIGNGTVALLRHPDQWDALVRDPGLAASAVEELLRYDGPVHDTGRIATVDVELDGRTIEAGQEAVVLLAAANRDPERFADPDRLDVRRADGPHLDFGHGIHHCLGAALARLEAQEAFQALARRMPSLHLAERPTRREHRVLRGFASVVVDPR